MGKLKDRYIRFDWAIKRLLRDKANFAVLEGLLTVLFEDKTQIVEILESEGNQLAETDKFNRVMAQSNRMYLSLSLPKNMVLFLLIYGMHHNFHDISF